MVTFFIVLLVVIYLAIGLVWGGLLNALTASGGDKIQPMAVVHGLFWPLSMLWVKLR